MRLNRHLSASYGILTYAIGGLLVIAGCDDDGGGSGEGGGESTGEEDGTDSGDDHSNEDDGGDTTGDGTTGDDTMGDDTMGDDTTGNDAIDGEAIYMAQCLSCHGADGVGAIAYELQHPVREFAEAVIREGREGSPESLGTMPPFSETALSDEELTAVFDYLDSFPQPTDGEGLYTDYCGNCHGVDGLGGSIGLGVVDLVDEADDILETAREGEGGADSLLIRTAYMPAFSDAQLSNDELAEIEDYVSGL